KLDLDSNIITLRLNQRQMLSSSIALAHMFIVGQPQTFDLTLLITGPPTFTSLAITGDDMAGTSPRTKAELGCTSVQELVITGDDHRNGTSIKTATMESWMPPFH
ncbi:unnamed protein product, partial [Ilex paraguariensis]